MLAFAGYRPGKRGDGGRPSGGRAQLPEVQTRLAPPRRRACAVDAPAPTCAGRWGGALRMRGERWSPSTSPHLTPAPLREGPSPLPATAGRSPLPPAPANLHGVHRSRRLLRSQSPQLRGQRLHHQPGREAAREAEGEGPAVSQLNASSRRTGPAPKGSGPTEPWWG